MAGLWDNAVGPPGSSNFRSWQDTNGVNFTVAQGCVCAALGFGHPAGGGSVTRTVKLFARATATTLGSVGVAANTNGGIFYANLATPVNLYANTVYSVAVDRDFNQYLLSWDGSVPPTPSYPLQWNVPIGCDRGSDVGYGYPTHTFTGTVPLADVQVSDAGGGPVGNWVTPDQLEAKLAAWFSSTNDNTHQGELPWLTHGQASGANSNAQNAWLTAQENQTAINVLLSRLTEDAAGKLVTFLDDYGINARGFFDAITAKVDNVAAAQGDILTWFGTYTGIPVFTYLGQALKWLSRIYAVPQIGAPDEYDVYETTYTETLAWPQEADAYFLSCTTVPALRTSEDTAGVDTRHRLGWWAPLNGTFSGERRYIDFPLAMLYDHSHERMPGLLLNTGKGSAGTVQAFVRKDNGGGG